MPLHLPNKKILSVDIGGSLAKAAFYIPMSHIKLLEEKKCLQEMAKDTSTSKSNH